MQYSQDYDERFPYFGMNAAANTNSGNPFGWADALQPYIKSTQVFQCPSETNGPNLDPTQDGYTEIISSAILLRLPLLKPR
jgi:hypothetical protein